MSNMKETKVKVIKNTLGLIKGDTLVLDIKTNDYIFNNTDVCEGTAAIANALTGYSVEDLSRRVSLSKSIVEEAIGEYFEYVKPEPVLKTIEEINQMIKDHQSEYNTAYDKLYNRGVLDTEDTQDSLREKLTVHWNIIKILEWSLGY